MKKRHCLVPLLLAASLTLGLASGCATMQQMLDDTPLPTASLVDVRISHLGLDSVGLAFDLEVQNPYPVELPLLGVEYSLASQGTAFSSGSSEAGGFVPAAGSRVITLPLDLVPSELLRTLSSVRPGQVVPYQADLKLKVDPPALQPLELPLAHDGELPIPTAPRVSVASVSWDELSLDSARGSIALMVDNPNQFGMSLSGLESSLSLGGREVADLATRQAVSWEAGQSQKIDLPLGFSPMDLGLSAFQMLTGGGADYALQGGLEVQTRFGALSLPLEATGQTTFLK